MPRPRKYSNHKLEAYGLYQQRKAKGEDVSALDLQVELEELHPEGTASYRLIADWVREFKQQDEWQALLDSPFQWHRIEEYGLPWECGRYVLDLYLKSSRYGDPERNVNYVVAPSVRQVRWWWRIHLAAPEVKGMDLILLAQRWVAREMAHDVLNVPLEMADLEALLIYRPWIGDQSRADYLLDVKDGVIPSLRHDPKQAARNAEKIKELAGELVIRSVSLDQFAEG